MNHGLTQIPYALTNALITAGAFLCYGMTGGFLIYYGDTCRNYYHLSQKRNKPNFLRHLCKSSENELFARVFLFS
ncbi:hypothetical protein CYL18_09960 [Pradoshia eiseniae]|uniref:Uncharacterized protein n=1 Tax=Pradoshia eiseniae TaxID=2064768 RepID=A0A2S7MZ48_9BACI|nr:hypothetical protein CYL18_09960 [Pradoshia eiseniae]